MGHFGMPEGVGGVTFIREEGSVSAVLEGTGLKADEYSLLLVDAAGNPFPLCYTKNTSYTENGDGNIQQVTLTLDENEAVRGKMRDYLMVDTYPAARGESVLSKAGHPKGCCGEDLSR